MSFGAAHDAKEQVRQAIDIVDLVGSYVELRRQGREYAGLCPWHNDTRPSLKVNPERQSWKCWVCDIGGDIFSFVMQRESVGFREALTMLAERAGVPLAPPPRQTEGRPGDAIDKPTLYRVAAWAEKQFHDFLLRSPSAEPARQYLENREINPASVEHFRLGYSPDSWQWLLDRSKSTPFPPSVLAAAGLVGKSSDSGQLYDRFRGRLIFPIRDVQRRPIAFGGRVLPGKEGDRVAKYINSPETRLFSKSEQLYGLDLARDAVMKHRSVIVVEGYTDVVTARQFGLENVVAVLGTALGTRHIHLLRRYADTVTLVLDGDEAGRRRTDEILELFVAEQVDVRIAMLPAGLDPCDFLLQRGPEQFRELVSAALDALEQRTRIATDGVDLARDTHGAHRALEEILKTLAKAPRLRSDTTASVRLREQQILSKLARRFHVKESELRSRIHELRRGSTSGPGPQAPQPAIRSLDPRSAELLEILCLHPSLAPTAIEQISVEQLAEGPGRSIYATYCRLHETGQSVAFSQVLTALEAPALKNILVLLMERASEKAEQVQLDAHTRLLDLAFQFRREDDEAAADATIAALESGNLDEHEELERLEQLFRVERNRQGISGPTDG